jgi:hypothetical protein
MEKFYVAANSVSSSTMPMMPRHVEVAPHSAVSETQSIPMTTGKELLRSMGLTAKGAYLKIDTQGGELKVLRGFADDVLEMSGIQVEISLEALYEGQPRPSEIIQFLGERGFELAYVIPGLRDPASHQLLQIDGIFTAPQPSSKTPVLTT